MTTVITKQMVADAYAKIGLKPIKCTTISNDLDCCCPLAALYLAEENNISQLDYVKNEMPVMPGYSLSILRDNVMLWAESKFGIEYKSGIIYGFDDRRVCNNTEVDMDAYNLGQELRRELLGA